MLSNGYSSRPGSSSGILNAGTAGPRSRHQAAPSCDSAIRRARCRTGLPRSAPAARRGADQLRAFARRPHNTALSPVAILRLMSRSIGLDGAQPEGEADDDISSPGPHRMAEHFVSGLHDLCREDSLLPTTWSETKPVRLVTARTILLAAMARFSNDPQSSFSMIRGASGSAGYGVDQWFSGLPSHSRDFLDRSTERQVPRLSKNCSKSGKDLERFS